MNLTTKQVLGVIALTISGLSAIAVPLLIHSPNTQANNNDAGQDNKNNGGNGPATNPVSGPNASPPGGQSNRQQKLKDIADKLGSCQTTNHGTQRSLIAKIQSAQRTVDSSKADHHLKALQHKLDTSTAEKHASACLSDLQRLVAGLLSP